MSNQPHVIAQKNLFVLSENPYPGRGIIAGLDESGEHLVQVYWIMGRSPSSRNRVFVKNRNGFIRTVGANPSIPIDKPELVLYAAMTKQLFVYAVSNGAQTDDACFARPLTRALYKWDYEPDEPNYTPRITSVFEISVKNNYLAEMAITKKSLLSDKTERHYYELDVSEPGLGYCMTTYKGDGDPLPAFEGDPYLLPLKGNIENVTEMMWDNLNAENKVAIVTRFINIKTKDSTFHIINKY